MGSGKTSVGQRLAALLARPFVDIDEEIEKSEGMPVSRIFARHGEPYFRALERKELARLNESGSMVIAVGGGAYCDAENRRAMDAAGITVWLDAPLDLIIARCGEIPDSRPLFGCREEMARLLEARRPSYALARHHIHAGDACVEELARRILDLLKASDEI